jgi:hypothetical protein
MRKKSISPSPIRKRKSASPLQELSRSRNFAKGTVLVALSNMQRVMRNVTLSSAEVAQLNIATEYLSLVYKLWDSNSRSLGLNSQGATPIFIKEE